MTTMAKCKLKSQLVSVLLVVAAGCNSRDVVATSGSVSTCEPDCICELFETNRYMFCAALSTWPAADAVCSAHGMRLARIDSAEENTWIRETADANDLVRLWIGTSDLTEEGVWRWTDGDLVLSVAAAGGAPGYHDFPAPEPNRGRGSNCGSMHESSSWHDQPCDFERSFVCRSPAP